ncbi:MAG: rhomboid family intramembrane serine protease [Bacteroidota bacterium]|nr:rhomboid family intramembrane serine protease [Bacteroidota bacterium]|tara:strand:+ start:570 stop:1208 length:639 start_codon:yes stop_codon:yes gene_type:complete
MTSPITFAIILITCIVSIISFNNSNVKKELILSPYKVLNEKKVWLLITHAFIHADYLHLFFNMYVLYMFGPYLELYFEYNASLGFISYILFYILSAIFATIPALYKNGNNPNYLSLGASGAVSAVVFAYIVLNPLRELGIILLPGIWIPGFIFGILYLVAENYMSKKKYSNIAHDAHISGSLFGVFFILFFDLKNASNFIETISTYITNLLS